MIKIFNPDDTVFSSNGNIAINPIKCIEVKKKSLNGWHLEVEVHSEFESDIKQDMLCVVKTKSKINPQAFRIKNIKIDDTKIKFEAEHVMFDARDYFLVDVRPTNLSAAGALNYVNTKVDKTSPFIINSNVAATSTAYFINRNLLEAWATIEERWGGIFDADNFKISLKSKIGNDNGETLVYGKDLNGVEIFEDWSNVVTRIYPTGPDGIMLSPKFIDSDISYPTPYTKKIAFESKLDDDPAQNLILEELMMNATEYLNVNKYPKVSYLIKSDVKDHVEIGDTIQVKHPLVTLMTEVQEYKYNTITKHIISLEFGNYSRDVKKKFDAIKEDIIKAKEQAFNAQWLTEQQTNIINKINKNGLVYIDDNEILILDKLPKEDAVEVWRWGLGGLGFSKNGYEGPYENAFTYDGYLNASFIKAGTINTNHLTSDVGSSLDLSSNTSLNLIVENIELKPGPQGPSGLDGSPGKDGTQGLQGKDGKQGIPGTKGNDGQKSYTHIAYADNADGGGLNQNPNGKTHIGMYTDFIVNDSTDPSKYKWSLIKGADGSQGLPGKAGLDGKTPYFHTAWSTAQDGSTGFSTTDSVGRSYIGTYTDYVTSDSNDPKKYQWVLMLGPKGETGEAGADGIGIESTEIRYQKSTSGTETPTGQWLTFIPIVQENEYLWTRITIKYTTGPDSVSYTIGGVGSQGSKGDTGADGKGIATTVVDYQISESGSAVPTGTWSTTLPPVLPNEYLWTRTTINYTTGSPSVAYSVGRVGKDGAKGDKGDTGSRGATGSVGPRGEDGTSIESIVEYYGLSTSDTVKPTSWTEIVSEATPLPKMTTTQKYLWNYEKINFSNGSNQDTVPVIVGVYGDTGSAGSAGIDGRSIVSIKEKYLVTSAASGVTRSTSGWIDTPSATSDTNKYLWNYEIITWNKTPITTYVDPIIIGVHGNKGDKGATGATGIAGPKGDNGLPTYTWIAYASSDTGTGISLNPTGKDYVGYASGQTSKTPLITTPSFYTWQLVKGATGEQGQQGIQGGKGEDGKPVYTWIKYADTPTTGMDDNPTGKKYIGMAFNKTTATESTSYGEYQWSLMPQNITVGGRNLLLSTFPKSQSKMIKSTDTNGFHYPSGSWASMFMYKEDLSKMLKPDTKYFITYKFRLDSLTPNTTAYNQDNHGALYLYSGIGSNPGIYLRDRNVDTITEANNWNAGDVVQREVVFTTPSNLHDILANYRLISYTRRSMSNGGTLANVESGTFYDVAIYEGDTKLDWTPAPEDINAEIGDIKDELDSVQADVIENTAQIALTKDAISAEVTERQLMGETIIQEATSLVEQTAINWDLMFTQISNDLTLNTENLESLSTYFRYDINGAIIGRSGSPITLHQINDAIEFRENGITFTSWRNATMDVNHLIAKISIIIGTHLGENYLSPTVGKSTLWRYVE